MGKRRNKKKEIRSIDLTKIENPAFVKDLNYRELEKLASDLRTEIIAQTAKNGGHLSSNLGTVEATIALYRNFDFPKDKLLFDVGHQTYAQKILTGRSLENLRKKGGISGFQSLEESIYDQYEAGHSSTSIGAATGMAIARDLNKENYEIIAFIGDASIANGVAFESLNYLGRSHHKVIILLNDNDMSISAPVGGFAKIFRRLKLSNSYLRSKDAYRRILFKTRLGYHIYRFTWWLKDKFARLVLPLNFFEQLGFHYIGTIDGHDLKSLDKSLKKAKGLKRSVIVHLKTTKGKGYRYSEKDGDGDWHGVGIFDITTGKSRLNHQNRMSWSDLYADLAEFILKTNPDAVLITPATLKGSKLEHIFKRYCSRAIDVGIAEENAFLVAQGLALNHKYPIISVYSTFMQRSFDQIIHDLARMNLKVLILVDRAGLVGQDGPTHHGIFDSAFLQSVPNITMAMAKDEVEAKALIELAKDVPGPFFLRYPRACLSLPLTVNSQTKIALGKWDITLSSPKKKLALISYGPLFKVLNEQLQKHDLTLVNAIFQKPVDEKVLNSLLDYEQLLIIDAYGVKEGFTNRVVAYLTKQHYQGKVHVKAIPNQFIKHATLEEQMEEIGLTPKQIISFIEEII
ncbi:MAG: 1-deoxy-D-xylulose-5-phosphate synthase [Bacilli bacterium]